MEVNHEVDIEMDSEDEREELSRERSSRRPSQIKIRPGLSVCERLRLLTVPVKTVEIVYHSEESERVYAIFPEAFRMWVYAGFIVFTLIAVVVSLLWLELDLNDNVMIDRFGYNNICVFFDFPPFSLFATTLWIPQVFTAVLYEYFDHCRIYDHYHAQDGVIGATFYRLYTAATIFETFAFCCFQQITATDPFEDMYVHSVPFLLLIFALWTMSLKRFCYFYVTGILEKHSKCVYYLAWTYVILFGFVCASKIAITGPNLFEAYLWKRPGLEWTGTFSAVIDQAFLFFGLICPLIIYYVLAPDLRSVVLVFKQTRP